MMQLLPMEVRFNLPIGLERSRFLHQPKSQTIWSDHDIRHLSDTLLIFPQTAFEAKLGQEFGSKAFFVPIKAFLWVILDGCKLPLAPCRCLLLGLRFFFLLLDEAAEKILTF